METPSAMASSKRAKRLLLALMLLGSTLPGCTSVREYIANGFKVGPNYKPPPAPVADDWIKASDWVGAEKEWTETQKRVRRETDDLSKWWAVFRDPVLDQLICHAYHQNLTLRQAGFQVLAARAVLGVAIGSFFPQSQYASGDYMRNANSKETAFSQFTPKRFYGQFEYHFNLAWELDFWGRFRRAIESANASLDASVFNYDDVLVTLLSDVAMNYVQLRVFEERIRYARNNVRLQEEAVKRVVARQKVGVAKQVDVDQVKAVLYQTWATIPELEIGLRTTNNQLCILLGIPPEELRLKIGPPPDPSKPIPYTPPDVAVGIPADLLRRRPDVREAERVAAAQSAQIGIAVSDWYPHVSVIGSFGWSAEKFRNLFNQFALVGNIGPSFQWNLLNYGRIINNVRNQDAIFQQLVAKYQNTVLIAQQEVENGLVTFLKAQRRLELQALGVKHIEEAAKSFLAQYEVGLVDISQVVLILQNLAVQQDTLAQSLGEVPTGLIQVYRALGGGWELRNTGCELPGDPHLLAPDPLRVRGCFLPYPRVLKQSALPMWPGWGPADYFDMGHGIEIGAPTPEDGGQRQPSVLPQPRIEGEQRLPPPRPMVEFGKAREIPQD